MFLQNASYWSGDKSEFDFYDADFIRDGQPHKCELLMIFTPQLVEPTTLEQVHDRRSASAVPTIQLKQLATVPRGIVVEQRSTIAWWRADLGSLAKISFSGTDSIDYAVKNIVEQRDGNSPTRKYSSDTSHGKIDMQPIDAPSGTALFYDELPLRVRMLDFSKTTGDFDVQLAPTITTGQKDFPGFKPAKMSWKIGERTIDVDLRHDVGVDHFVLDRDFPFLLRDWQMADGSRLKMKTSLRVDYRNYFNNRDRDRAHKDPMLRHPD